MQPGSCRSDSLSFSFRGSWLAVDFRHPQCSLWSPPYWSAHAVSLQGGGGSSGGAQPVGETLTAPSLPTGADVTPGGGPEVAGTAEEAQEEPEQHGSSRGAAKGSAAKLPGQKTTAAAAGTKGKAAKVSERRWGTVAHQWLWRTRGGLLWLWKEHGVRNWCALQGHHMMHRHGCFELGRQRWLGYLPKVSEMITPCQQRGALLMHRSVSGPCPCHCDFHVLAAPAGLEIHGVPC